MVPKLRALLGNYALSERLLCAFVRSFGAWTADSPLAADLLAVFMFLLWIVSDTVPCLFVGGFFGRFLWLVVCFF